MRLHPIIEHLKDNCPLLERRVEYAQGLVSLDEQDIQEGLPIAWLGRIRGEGGQNILKKGTAQTRRDFFGILVAAESVTDNTGAVDPLQDVAEQIDSQLLAYGNGSINYVKDEFFDISKRVVYWMFVYEYVYLKATV